MTGELLIKSVLPRSGTTTDVLITGGRIADIGPDLAAPAGVPELDGRGKVLLPAFVDAHSHLDKSLAGMGWYRREPGRGLQQMVAEERRLRRSADWDYQRQIGRNLELMIAAGATRTRAFVDVDLEGELRGLEAMLSVRDRYADAVSMQIIAFPQSGIQAWPGTLELLEEAVRQGADVIGGIDPCMLERDPVANLDAIFDLAVRHGAGIDVHLHEPGPLGAFSAELIIERTRVNQLAGRVVISHPDFLGGIAPGQASKIISELVDAGIGVTTNVPGSDPKPPLALMREAGLIVGSGCDGALDSWAPMNRSDMLFKGYELAWRNGLGADEELDLVYDYICTGGALLMGVEDPGLRIGAEADLVLMPGETPIEPIVALPSDRTVIKAGRVVADGGQFLASRSTAG